MFGKFTLEIRLGDAAMQDMDAVIDALERTASSLRYVGGTSGAIQDANGNTVGQWGLRPEKEPRFTVVENTPGYLPEEDDPATFGTFEEAEAYAEERASTLASEDESAEGWVRESKTLWRVTFAGPHALDRVVEIIEEET